MKKTDDSEKQNKVKKLKANKHIIKDLDTRGSDVKGGQEMPPFPRGNR